MKSFRAVIMYGAIVVAIVEAYRRSPCTRKDRRSFQFEGCYIPPLDESLPITEASFLLSHNSATGYIYRASLTQGGLTSSYSKNQVGTVYDQLNDGARALDLRPKYLTNGTVIFHHGSIDIRIPFERLVSDAVRWCSDNQDELVLLLTSHLAYESRNHVEGNGDSPGIAAMTSIYKHLGVPYYGCDVMYGLTVAETMDLAALPSGGYLLALDGQDFYASSCAKANWVPDQLVTCYPQGDTSIKCTEGRDSEPMHSLQQYVLESANNQATDDEYVLGPPVNLYTHPFNEIQAMWQIDSTSAKVGVTHFSTLLKDNRQSHVNAEMVHMIFKGEFDHISLFAVDNVALNGNALLSVLRTTCGQSTVGECGKDLKMPRMESVPVTIILVCVFLLVYVPVVLFRIFRKVHLEEPCSSFLEARPSGANLLHIEASEGSSCSSQAYVTVREVTCSVNSTADE